MKQSVYSKAIEEYVKAQIETNASLIKDTKNLIASAQNLDDLQKYGECLKDYANKQQIAERALKYFRESEIAQQCANGFYTNRCYTYCTSYIYESVIDKTKYHDYKVGDKEFSTIKEAKEYSKSLGVKPNFKELAFQCLSMQHC